MKKIFRLAIIITILLLFATACSIEDNKVNNGIIDNNNINNNTAKDKPVKRADKNKVIDSSAKVEDFTPFTKDILYIYEGVGDEYAGQEIYVEFIENNSAQMKIFNSGTTTVRILEHEDGELREVYTESEFYHIENKIGVESNSGSVLLKEPIQIGNSWETIDGKKRSITGVNTEISLPYEDLTAVEVTTELGEGIVQLDYYAVGIGHVASIYKDGDYEVKTLLDKVIKGPLEKNIRFYYPLGDATGLVYKDKKIKFTTNTKIEDIFEEELKNPENDTLIKVLSKDSKINSLKLDKTNNLVRVDLNKNFLENNMKVGSAEEYDILQSLVNTLGAYYDVNKVAITVDDSSYSSGHFILEAEEYFTTTDDAVKIVD